jgi:hypothetical protein
LHRISLKRRLALSAAYTSHVLFTCCPAYTSHLLPTYFPAAIDAQSVKSLREATGAGMMDCKKALVENDGDVTAAMEFLRKKGLASAEKKANRATKEGIIETYIHTGTLSLH